MASGPKGSGLSSQRAAALLAEVGPNSVPERRESVPARLVGKLWAPVPWMLEATIALEVALGKWLDGDGGCKGEGKMRPGCRERRA